MTKFYTQGGKVYVENELGNSRLIEPHEWAEYQNSLVPSPVVKEVEPKPEDKPEPPLSPTKWSWEK